MFLPKVLALLLATGLPAQAGSRPATHTLRGVVRDLQGAPVPGARVDIACGGERHQVLAGPAGEFSESGLRGSRCVVTAHSDLFEGRAAVVDPGSGEPLTLVLSLPAFAAAVTVTATRGIDEATFRVPEPTSATSREQMDARPFVLLPQVLREEPGILLQQTTSAQLSPTIRGFTGTSNVYLIDGVRFNTSTWRGGPSQYLAWIDGGAVERIEVVRGPGSVQYGSDALGGTINVMTGQQSLLPAGARLAFGGEGGVVFRSADGTKGGHADVRVHGTAATFHFGGSSSRVDDLRAGGGIDSHSAATRFLGQSSSVFGTRMKDTGFSQSGGYMLGNIRAGEDGTFRTVYMHGNQTGVTRYDRVWGGDGLYRSGFEPQTLDFGLLRYQRTNTRGFDGFSATFSVNNQADGRFEQTRPTAVFDTQESVTRALGYQLQGHRQLGRHHQISVGTEFYDEAVAASRRQVNPQTNAAVSNRPDVPDGTAYTSLGVFAQDVMELGRLSLRAGLRYGRYRFSTVEDVALGVPNEQVTTNAVTFQVGTIVSLSDRVNATLSVNRGFRAANAADLGGIGLTGGGGFEISPTRSAALGGIVGSTVGSDASSTGEVVPALRPEVLYSFEPGVRVRTDRFSGALTLFDLEYLDTVQRRAIVFPAGVAGSSISGYAIVRQDAAGLAYIAQDIRPIATRVNVDRARIYGFEVNGDARLARGWSVSAFLGMSNGRLLSTGEFLRRMSPPLGGSRVRWSAGRGWLEGVVSVAAAQTRLSSGDLTDARIGATRTRTSIATYFSGTATDLGLVKNGILVATGEALAQVQNRLLGSATSAPLFTKAPGFVVLGARAGFPLSSHFDVIVIGENLTDRNYRLYGSGVDAPGVNLQVKMRYRF